MTAVRAFAVVLALALASIPTLVVWRSAQPDHVTRLIDRGSSAYRRGDLDSARTNLRWALLSISVDNRKRYEAVLPVPLIDWIPGRDNTVKSPFPYSEGKVSREYSKRVSGESIRVWIGTRDPHFALSITDLIGTGPSAKILRISDAPAVITADGDVFIETDTLVVMVSGSASDADKLAFAKAVDIAELAKFK